MSATTVVTILELAGLYVFATSGALLASRDIDILFTDIIMPEAMNGIELAVFTRDNYPDVKIILASGYPLPALKLDPAHLQEFAFVNKPYRLSDLARALRTAA